MSVEILGTARVTFVFVTSTHIQRKTALASPGRQGTLTSDSPTNYDREKHRARTGDLLASRTVFETL
jgi:hypothetical protein